MALRMRALKIILAFLAGLGGWLWWVFQDFGVIWYIVATSYFGVFDRDGGGAMGAIFIMGPILALIVGIAAAIVIAVKTRAA